MTGLNIVYGVLSNGRCNGRKCTANIKLNKDQQRLRDALFTTNVEDISGVVELYIRLCQSDKELKALLRDVDPLNTYSFVTLTPTISPTTFDIETVNKNILGLGIVDIENSATVWDNIKLCLKTLLQTLK